MPYDLIISGGTVVDGSGLPGVRPDVGVADGTIAAVGNLSGERAREKIDADGQVVAPGLPTLVRDLPAGTPRIKQKTEGIRATVVNGEVLMRDNEHTGAYPGRLLRGPLAHN